MIIGVGEDSCPRNWESWTVRMRKPSRDCSKLSKNGDIPGIQPIISGGYTDIQNMAEIAFLDAPWQMCQIHVIRGGLEEYPPKTPKGVAKGLSETHGTNEEALFRLVGPS